MNKRPSREPPSVLRVPAGRKTRESGCGADGRRFLLGSLYEWGVRRVFGYPGDGINGLLGALNRFGEDKIRFVQVRHEEMAAFMASAHAKQIDLKPDMLSIRYPMEVNLVGDSAEALRALLPLLDEKADRSWRATIEQNVAA